MIPFKRLPARVLMVGLLFLPLLLSSCGDSLTEVPSEKDVALLVVRAELGAAAASVAQVVLEVTAPDITTPLVFSLTITDGVASGTMEIPAGSDRTITARAFDAGAVETHRGETTTDIVGGTNPTLSLTLLPLTGTVPIDITMTSVTVTVTPNPASLTEGDTLRLSAVVKDASGDVLDVTVQWASLDPAVAVVDGSGLVTGVGVGTTQVVATYGGVGGASDVTVDPALSPTLGLIASGLDSPVYLTAPPGEDQRQYVVLQGGQIRVLENDVLLATPFLDLSSSVVMEREAGLLSMAFHPDFAVNGHFFVVYNTGSPMELRVERFTVTGDPNVADATSGTPILSIPKSSTRHQGGQLAFGPLGYLYLTVGDDQLSGAGQSTDDLLGAVIRIDVDGGSPYAIPASNPFVGVSGAREELWAIGLRNPWRASFDPDTGDFYLSDVGEGSWEEVNVQPAASLGGENYGWKIMEGSSCVSDPCDTSGLTLPTFEYGHVDGACSVTGGYVYRGSKLPVLFGEYLYADFCSAFVRSFKYENGTVVSEADWTAQLSPAENITSFGEDASGELYILTISGNVYRIVPA